MALAGLLGLVFSIGYCIWYLDRHIETRKDEIESDSQQLLNLSVDSIEFYKKYRGEYPDDLSDIYHAFTASPDYSIKSKVIPLLDPRFGKFFYYRKIDSAHYYLRGLAPDGNPFSQGALIPQSTSEQTGLVTTSPAGPPIP